MRNCDNYNNGSYGLDCNTGIETLYCRESEYEHDVLPTDVCEGHQYIDGLEECDVLGYDCDGNAIDEFRILRFPFSVGIEDWKKESNVDPRFYTLIKNSKGDVYAISVYDDWQRDHIRRYEFLNEEEDIPVLIKSVSDMRYYEVAFDGLTGNEWYYDRNRLELRNLLDDIIRNQNGISRKLSKK